MIQTRKEGNVSDVGPFLPATTWLIIITVPGVLGFNPLPILAGKNGNR